jgi:hypothetical protein
MIHPLSSSAGRNEAYIAMGSVKFRGQIAGSDVRIKSDTIFPLPAPGHIVRLRSGDREPCRDAAHRVRMIEIAPEFYTLANYGFDKGSAERREEPCQAWHLPLWGLKN